MKATLPLLSLGALVLVGASALGLATTIAEHPDCPGTITCPLTGEEICRDECPNIDPDRSDCPGRIECPLTGELTCVDECPLEQDGGAALAPPPCCATEE